MPATAMITRAAIEAVVFGQQAMKAGDADVVQPVDVVPHDLGARWPLPRPPVCQKFPPRRPE